MTRGRRHAAAVLLGVGTAWSLWSAPLAAASSAHGGHPLAILSYNVHGLFRLAAKDAPAHRSRTIGWLANRYDVVLLQEDFEYHQAIAGQFRNRAIIRGRGMRLDPRLLAARILLFPAWLLIPHFSPPYGDGLTVILDDGLAVRQEIVRERFDTCAGWLGDNKDCWASKGFVMTPARLPSGAVIHLYNTHLESGGTPSDQAARRRQLDTLAGAIERLSAGQAVIVAGDLNCAFNRPGDGEMLMAFRARVGLADTGAGPDLSGWRERDYILYRSGLETTLDVDAAGEALEFVNEDRALSDHPAVFAVVRVAPGGGSDGRALAP